MGVGSSRSAAEQFAHKANALKENGWMPLFALLNDIRERLKKILQENGQHALYFGQLSEVIFRCNNSSGKREFTPTEKSIVESHLNFWESERLIALKTLQLLNQRGNRLADAYEAFQQFTGATVEKLKRTVPVNDPLTAADADNLLNANNLFNSSMSTLDKFKLAIVASNDEWSNKLIEMNERNAQARKRWSYWSQVDGPALTLLPWQLCVNDVLANRCIANPLKSTCLSKRTGGRFLIPNLLRHY